VTMPIDLVLVRHGQSEQNLAYHFARNGDPSLMTEAFRARHASQHRLTKRGRTQASIAGDWLRANGLGQFERAYCSTYIRAIETAGLLDLSVPYWREDPHLREREYGELEGMTDEERVARFAQLMQIRQTDPYYWTPVGGESDAQVSMRLRSGVIDTLARECSEMRVVIVCHGEVMWDFRPVLERMPIAQWTKLKVSDEPGVRIFNCQVIHYTRRNPVTGQLSAHLEWMRSVCPPNPDNDGPGWQQIVRPNFSNADLLAIAEQVPPLFPDHPGY
jgi:broad specificity phosphatase PhoE